MAVEATFAALQRFVLESGILDISDHIFMAIKTELVAWFQQNKPVV